MQAIKVYAFNIFGLAPARTNDIAKINKKPTPSTNLLI